MTYTPVMALTIAAVDRSADLDTYTLAGVARGYGQIATLGFALDDPNLSLAISPEEEVIWTQDGERIFAGPIRDLGEVHEGGHTLGRRYQVTCQDYTALLHDDVIDTAYRSAEESDKERITWLVQTWGTKGITAGVEVIELLAAMPGGEDGRPEQDFSGKTLYAAIEQVCKITGAAFYVDHNKRLHVYDPAVGDAAPFHLSDNPNGSTTFGYRGFTFSRDTVELVHQVLVRGTGLAVWVPDNDEPSLPALADRRRSVITDSGITSEAQATQAGTAFLARHGDQRRSGSLTTDKAGLHPGMRVQVTNSGWGYMDEEFIIQSVATKMLNGERAEFLIQVGAPEIDLSSYLAPARSGLVEVTEIAQGTASQMADLSVGGANMARNSSFELADVTGYEIGAGWVFGHETADAYDGEKVARADRSAAVLGDLATPAISVDRLDDWWISALSWMRAYTGGTALIELREYSATDTLLATTVIASITAAEPRWTRHAIHMGPNDQLGRHAFHADTVAVRIAWRSDGAATFGWEIDAYQVERGQTLTAYARTPGELGDGAIGETQVGPAAITSPKVAATAILAHHLAAAIVTSEHISTVGLLADLIRAGTLRLGGMADMPDVLLVYNTAGDEIGRWDENGLLIADPADTLLQMRLADGGLAFSADGGATWQTAISAEGVNADAIRLGTLPGGHNSIPNSSFELAAWTSELAKVWTSAADWQSHLDTTINITDSGTSLTLTDAAV